jgi:hypothetical protein
MTVFNCPECGQVPQHYSNCPLNIKECKVCKDKYTGNPENWGWEIEPNIIICFYCYSGEQDRKWTPEWKASK